MTNKIKFPDSFKVINQKAQQGALLIESMVAITIFSIGLLSLSALQLSSSKNALSSTLRTESAIVASELVDMMRSNLDGVLAGNYNIDFGDSPVSSSSVQGEIDIEKWINTLTTGGLQGAGLETEGAVACDLGTRDCTISVRWNDNRAAEIGVDIDESTVTTTPDIRFLYRIRVNL